MDHPSVRKTSDYVTFLLHRPRVNFEYPLVLVLTWAPSLSLKPTLRKGQQKLLTPVA